MDRFEYMIVLDQKGPLSSLLDQERLAYTILPPDNFPGWKQGGILQQLRTIAATASERFRFLRRHGISVVHTNDMRMHLAWAGPSKMTKSGFIWHQRAIFPRSRMLLHATGMADRIVANSHFTASTFQAAKVRKKIRVVYNPFEDGLSAIDRSDAKLKLLSEFNKPDETWVVGFFANLLENKRPLVFARAASNILETLGPKVVFPLFGTERDEQASLLRKATQGLGLTDHIRLMGFRHPAELWLAACDIILVPAVGDSFGRTLVEAMMVGTPVVAAASGGHLEIIENGRNGMLVTPDDPKAFADAALRLIQSKDRRAEIVEYAKEFARTHYHAKRHAEEISKMYEEIVAHRALKRRNA